HPLSRSLPTSRAPTTATASECPPWSCRPMHGRTTCRTGYGITPPSSSSSRRSGTSARSPTVTRTPTTCSTAWTSTIRRRSSSRRRCRHRRSTPPIRRPARRGIRDRFRRGAQAPSAWACRWPRCGVPRDAGEATAFYNGWPPQLEVALMAGRRRGIDVVVVAGHDAHVVVGVEAEDEIRLHAVPGEGAARIGRIGRRTLGRVGTLGRAALGGAGERRERLQHGPPRCHARLLLAAELRLGRVVVRA